MEEILTELQAQEHIRAEVRVLTDFPLDVYPRKISTFVESLAASMPAPVGWVGAGVLNVCAAAIGHRRKMQVKEDWVERSVLWVALTGDSGTRKSPVLSRLSRPLHAIEKALVRENGQKLREWMELAPAEKKKTPQPGIQQMVFTSITWEALIRAVADSRDFWGEYDELSAFLNEMGQYKSGGGSDRDHWVSLHSRGLINYRRVKDNLRVYKQDVCCSMMGGIQPSKLSMLRNKSGDGLEYRFLYAKGDYIPLGEGVGRTLNSDWYDGTIEVLHDLMELTHVAPKSCYNYLVKKEQEYVRANIEAGVMAKATGHIARIAIVLAELRMMEEGTISAIRDEDFERAGLLMDYFVETWEAEIVGNIDRAPDAAKRVNVFTVYDLARVVWAKMSSVPVSRSKIMQGGWAGLDTREKMLSIIHIIEDLGDDSPIETWREGKAQMFRVPVEPVR